MTCSVLVPGSDSIVDFSLWSVKKIEPIGASLLKKFDVPLAILRIQRNKLDAPITNGTDDLTLVHGVGRNLGATKIGEYGNLGVPGRRDGFVPWLQDKEHGDIGEFKRRHRDGIHSELTSAK